MKFVYEKMWHLNISRFFSDITAVQSQKAATAFFHL